MATAAIQRTGDVEGNLRVTVAAQKVQALGTAGEIAAATNLSAWTAQVVAFGY